MQNQYVVTMQDLRVLVLGGVITVLQCSTLSQRVYDVEHVIEVTTTLVMKKLLVMLCFMIIFCHTHDVCGPYVDTYTRDSM